MTERYTALTVADDVIWCLTKNLLVAFSESRRSEGVDDGVTHGAQVQEGVGLGREGSEVGQWVVCVWSVGVVCMVSEWHVYGQ